MVIREFRCADCGCVFESSDPVESVECPSCSAQEAERVFLTPPGIKSPQTTSADSTLKGLAADYGISNMSNRDGAAVRQAPAGAQAPQFASANPQTMQILSKLGSNADAFSPILPTMRRAGGPAPTWQYRDSRNKPVR